MARNLLDRLLDRLAPDMHGLVRTTDGLELATDARYGNVSVVIAHDVEAEMLRVAVAVPPPAGGGVDFLLWCMNQNAVYWDVKFGIDGRGLLLIHSDLDAHRALDIEDLATAVFERSQTVIELLDDDYVEWLLDNKLATAQQAAGWSESD